LAEEIPVFPHLILYKIIVLIRRFLGACFEVTLQREECEKPWCLTDNALPCDTPQLAAGRLHWIFPHRMSTKRRDTVGQSSSVEIGVSHMPSLKAKKLRKLPREKVLLDL
jgi:hypothetical protein